MRKHRIEIRVLCVLQKAKHWDEGIESEGIDIDGIGGKDIDGEGKDDYRCVASPQ